MTTANKITLVRIAMIPVFIWFAYVGGKTGDWVALGVFLLASLTDFLDGQIGVHPNENTATVWLNTADLAALLAEYEHPVSCLRFS